MNIIQFVIKNFKTIVYVLLGFLLLKTIKDIFGNGSKVDELRDESKSTLSKDVIADISDRLFDALVTYTQGTLSFRVPGTDEEAVYRQLSRMNNQADYNAVYNKFGKVSYNETAGIKMTPFDEKHDLSFILNNEMNDDEKDKIRNDYPHLTIF